MLDSFAHGVPKAVSEPTLHIQQPPESELPENNHGADVSTLMRMIEASEP
ncbi:MAG: hypothetical protein IT523_01195 [Burkholderiales bacterium]|nr:hypothetical protein [Burkholderiales bacterium]